MSEVTLVKHVNAYGEVIATTPCHSNHEVRKAVGRILDVWFDGDTIKFEVVQA